MLHFKFISLATTTGFATADTPNWPIFSILILIYYTIQCGMVGSTSGGLKFDRVYLFFQSLIKNTTQIGKTSQRCVCSQSR
jgi:trk system potassium uptake protein TrkH